MSLSDSLRFRVGADFSDANRSLTTFARSAGAAVAGAFSLGAAARLTQAFVEAGSEMETFESRLTTLMGSAAEARARMQELFQFAATTPFELNQVVAAETTLRGFGAAAEELMPGLIDFAATTGADMSQAAIDIGKAWSQGATGLESDFGRVLRKQIELSTGVNATTMELEDFRQALLDTLGNGIFAGGADRLSRTFAGMMSNLRDEWSRFKLAVSDAGLFNNVKGALSVTLDLIGDNREALGEMASFTSDVLWQSFRAFAEVVGVAATGIRGIQIGLALAAGPAADLAAAIIEFYEPVRRMAIMFADRLGLDKVTVAMLKLDGSMGAARSTLEGIRDRSVEFVRGAMDAKTPLEEVRDLLQAAEDAASGMADEIDRVGDGGPDGKGGGDGGGGKPPKPPKGPTEEELAAARAYIDELNALDDTREERIRALYEERAWKLIELNEKGLLTEQDYADGVVAIYQERDSALARLEEEGRAFRQELHEETLRQIEAEKRERLASFQTQVGAFSQMMHSMTSLLQAQGEKAKGIHKAFAIASIIIDTAMGIQKAFAEYGWPGGILPAAAVSAEGTVQTAAVLQAHQGGAFAIGGPTPDEVDLSVGGGRRRVLRGEVVSVGNTQVARKMADANATNGASMGGTAVLNLTIGRAAQREVIRGEARYGEYLRGFVRGVNRDSFAAGWSGAGVIA